MKRFITFIDQQGLSVFSLLLSDAFWYSVSFLLAYFVRNNVWPTGEIQPLNIYLKTIPPVLILLIVVFYLHGLYEQTKRIRPISEMYLLIKSLTICLVLIMAASFLQKYDYSRVLVILFWWFSLFFITFGRYLIRRVKSYLFKKGYGLTRVVIIGAGKVGKRLARALQEYEPFGYRIAGFIDDQVKASDSLPYPILGNLDNLDELIKKLPIQQVFVADPAMSHEDILNLVQKYEGQPVKFKIVSDLFEIIAGEVNMNNIEEIPAIDLSKQAPGIFYDFSKRLLDVFLSLFGLLIFAPIGFFIAVIIKIDSNGAVFFWQTRVGKNGKLFAMIKFRTMLPETSDQAFSPRSTDDSRITRFGRYLRRTSLDELPQLWNVFLGDMSLVGPRPEMPFIVAKYKPWQKKRLEVKPGLTGLWQVMGRKELPLLENIEYDFFYIKNRSFLLDIVIIIKTILVVLSGRGAY